jgi:hypothetical protein
MNTGLVWKHNRTVPRRLLAVAGLGLAFAMSAACGPVQAKTPEDDAPLVTPMAPPRVIVPVPIDPPAPIEPARPASRETTTAAPGKPAVATSSPASVATPPSTSPPPPQPDPIGPILQTTANVTEAERRARATLGRALADLAHVDYRGLSPDARAQYDQAKRFITQADAALKVKNVVFAEQLADKAASLAGLLVRRL